MKLGPRQALTLLRLYLYGVLTALVVYYFLGLAVGQWQSSNARLVAQTTTQQHQITDLESQIAELESTVADLRARWLGDPALWQPAGVPANTRVEWFDVTGTTQADLIDALQNDGLCQKYHCLPDPAVPGNSVAWALEGDGSIDPNTAYCYSPRMLSYSFEDHTVTLPRWSPKVGDPKTTVVQAWNALEQVLLVHELGHVQVAEDWLASMNAQAHALPTCQAATNFWSDPHLWDSLDAAQNAYHAKLRADCRPEVGCIPAYWMGW